VASYVSSKTGEPVELWGYEIPEASRLQAAT